MIGGRNAFRLGLCNYVVDCEKQAKRSKGDDGVDTATSVRDEESATDVKEEHTERNEGKVLEENLDENKEENKEENKVEIKEGEYRNENRNANLSRKSKVDFKDGVDRKSKLLSFALRIAREISDGGPVAMSAAFAAVKGASSHSETICYNLCFGQGDKDRKEALAAFKEKRKPRFSGRESHVEFVKLEELETARHRARGGEGVEDRKAMLDTLMGSLGPSSRQPPDLLRQRHRTPEEEVDRAFMRLERSVERLGFEEQKLTNRFNAILKKTTKFLEHIKLHPGERDRYMNNMNSTNKHMEDMLTRKDQLKGVGKAEGGADVMYRKTNRDPSRRQYPPKFATKRPSYLSNLDTPEGKAKYQEMRSLRRRVNMLKRRERWLKEQFQAIVIPQAEKEIS